jgi:hypothetical protein
MALFVSGMSAGLLLDKPIDKAPAASRLNLNMDHSQEMLLAMGKVAFTGALGYAWYRLISHS